ncbi:3D domain-containing protein [Peribacillus kribbensis]|uniref:3D domain-containing protein n=1 Tax=Peribacillus kribbensis TaxID=356658 RepID=UPI000404441F|nr:3D domain-containing protein [Peribacillus kribbensis]
MKKISIFAGLLLFLSFGANGIASASSNTYQVKSGDTLWGISKKYHISVSQLKSWNKLKSDHIKPKQVLKISASAAAPAAKKAASVSPAASYKEITVTATAYTASCKGCSGITSTGLNLKKNPNAKAISVDPKVIPLGSKVYVPGYGYAVAADKGSSVRGNKIDVFISNKSKALQWGRKTVKIKIMK